MQIFTYLASQLTVIEMQPDSILSLIITSVISASVIGAIVTGVVQYLVNKRNSQITEKKNTIDAESDLITRYKEAAAEERAQKESAVETVKDLLQVAEHNVELLKNTVDTLNQTITSLKETNAAQQQIITQLTVDRDRAEEGVRQAERTIAAQREHLARLQQQVAELTGIQPSL